MDRISQLPDEILDYILSFLTFQEAARTSVLSKRWIDLWMSFARLDFDAPKLLEGLEEIDEYPPYNALLKRRRRQYTKWVNKVLQSHKATALDAFRIRFNLDKSSRNHVNKWLEYAFARKVQTLDLNLYDEGDLPCESKAYVFPHGLIGLGNENSSAVSLSGYQGDGINSNAFHGFKSLRALTLKNVNVSGEVLEYFLHNCPFLENLTVRSTAYLTHFKVCGSSLALKHLDLCYCHSLSLTVCDTNIVSLKTTRGHKLALKNVPMLVDVFVAGWSSRKFVRGVTSWLSCCLLKLEVLTLQMRNCDVRLEKAMGVVLPQLSKLKQLTFAVQASEDDSLMVFTSLIRASPNLEKFVLKLNWEDDIARIRTESEKALAFPLQHLKVVELCGYYGRRTEVELVEYLLENAIALERVTVDPRDQPLSGPNYEFPEKEEIARNLAREQLRELVPSHVELEIL